MSYSQVQIYNMALNNLGVSASIQNTTQQDPRSVTLNNFYGVALRQVLKDFDWNFASKDRELTPTFNTPANPKYQYEYDYPNDCISARQILNSDKVQFEVVSNESGARVINTTISPATLRYTRYVDKETYFTPEFAIALSWYLAFLVALAITGSSDKRRELFAIYKDMINSSITSIAQEGYEDNEKDADWLEAR